MRKHQLTILTVLNVITLTLCITLFYKYQQTNTLLINQVTRSDNFTNYQRDISLASLPVKKDDIIPSLSPIAKNVIPAIVNISTKNKIIVNSNSIYTHPFFQDPLFEKFFRFPQEGTQTQKETHAIGSGVIVDRDEGYILTNHHVIDNAEEIYVTLLDKTRLRAELIGSDPETDIAVLKIKPSNLTSMPLGESAKLEVGDFVIAVGNPFGLGHTVTSGIVSALSRSGLGIEGYEDFIQTDASINPGNSGGALVNLRGELIGINTAILSKTGSNVGIGFAIPIDMAKSVMQQLIEHGKVERGQIGVQVQSITPEIIDIMGLQINSGALVINVENNSSAEQAGIKAGDIITKLNDEIITSAQELRNKVGVLRVGEEIKITLLREGKNIEKTVKIGTATNITTANVTESTNKLLQGASFQEHPEGVLVSEVNNSSPAYNSGLRKGDIIFAVNKEKVTTPAELFIAAEKNDKGIMINLKRQNTIMFIVIH